MKRFWRFLEKLVGWWWKRGATLSNCRHRHFESNLPDPQKFLFLSAGLGRLTLNVKATLQFVSHHLVCQSAGSFSVVKGSRIHAGASIKRLTQRGQTAAPGKAPVNAWIRGLRGKGGENILVELLCYFPPPQVNNRTSLGMDFKG